MIQNSNFHQLRKHQKEQERIKAREEARRTQRLKHSLESDLLGGLEESPTKNRESDTMLLDGGSPLLHQIEEDDEDEMQ